MDIITDEVVNAESQHSLNLEGFKEIILKIMDYKYAIDFKLVRLINHSCNEAFKDPNILNLFQFVIDGKFGKEAIETLCTSSVPWPIVIFKNIDVENEFMRKAEYFDRFFNNNQDTLKTLKFINCQMSGARLTEILSRLNSLDSLVIINSPTCFIATHSILNFGYLLPYFVQTVNELKSLTIRNADLNSESVELLLSESHKLVSVDLASTKAPFPREIFKFLVKKAKTLKVLTLSGSIFVDNTIINSFKKLNLQYISLDKFEYQTSIGFATQFLNRQILLRRLVFNKTILTWNLFVGIDKLRRLHSLILSDCVFKSGDQNGFGLLNRIKFLETISIKDSEPKTFTEDQNKQLSSIFENPYENLKAVKLRLATNIGATLKNIYASCKNLKILELDWAHELTMENLQFVWILSKLVRLEIRCCKLSDLEIVPPMDKLSTLSLCDLRNLECLSLAATSIGNETICTQVIQLSKLEHLDVSNTKITKSGLKFISSYRKANLPNLSDISFDQCSGCCFTEKEFNNFKEEMKPVRLFFNSELTWGWQDLTQQKSKS